jgi:hypothetical protein
MTNDQIIGDIDKLNDTDVRCAISDRVSGRSVSIGLGGGDQLRVSTSRRAMVFGEGLGAIFSATLTPAQARKAAKAIRQMADRIDPDGADVPTFRQWPITKQKR